MLRLESPADHISFRHEAMATEFSITLGGAEKSYLRQASQECFSLIDDLESKLSLYRENSDVTRINRASEGAEVVVSQECVECLATAAQASQATHGRFHIFIGQQALKAKSNRPSFLAGFAESEDRVPSEEPAISVNAASRIVKKISAGSLLDLGAIGKGFALDKIVEVLEDWEVPSAMINSGGSTLLFYSNPTVDIWRATLDGKSLKPFGKGALASSGLGFQDSHIIDPSTMQPASHWRRSYVFADTAGKADAYSTATMLMSWEEILNLSALEDSLSIAVESEDGLQSCGDFFNSWESE